MLEKFARDQWEHQQQCPDIWDSIIHAKDRLRDDTTRQPNSRLDGARSRSKPHTRPTHTSRGQHPTRPRPPPGRVRDRKLHHLQHPGWAGGPIPASTANGRRSEKGRGGRRTRETAGQGKQRVAARTTGTLPSKRAATRTWFSRPRRTEQQAVDRNRDGRPRLARVALRARTWVSKRKGSGRPTNQRNRRPGKTTSRRAGTLPSKAATRTWFSSKDRTTGRG